MTIPAVVRLLALSSVALLSACGRAAAPSAHPDGGMTTPSSPVGGIGGCECSSDAYCAAQEDDFVNSLEQPLVTNRHYVGAACVARDPNDPLRCCFARPAVCACYFAWGDGDARALQGAEILGDRDTCDVDSREQGCLFRSCEFRGCSPADPTSCDAACADLAARIAADDAKTFDVERRAAYCDPTSCLCRAVHRIGDRCFATRAPFATSYDCALPDATIIASTYPPAPTSSSTSATQADPDAAAPTCD